MFTPLHIIFYFFAAIAITSAISVITVRHPVRSVLSLVITFFAMASIWMMLQAEFLSLILLLVYVGAVMTLFLFVVMMLDVEREVKQSGFVRYLPLGMIAIILMVGLIVISIWPSHFEMMPNVCSNESNTKQLGMALYTVYFYPFEIAGVLLLAAMIAAITLTHRAPTKRKIQNPARQIAVRPEDRIRLIKMSASPKEGSSS